MHAMVQLARGRRRAGAAMIYVLISMVAMMALCSLVVDLGRYEVVHSQLYDACVAASRAGATNIPYGATAVTNAATNTATSNTVDGQAITSASVTIQYLNWTSKANCPVVAFASANAIRVSITYTVPLAFAKIIGLSSKIAVESSTAMLNLQTATPYVYATGNPWLAGEPNGTTASQPDPGWAGTNVNTNHRYQYDIAGTPGKGTNGSTASYNGTAEPYASPVQVAVNVTPGAIILVTGVSGSVSYDAATAPYIDGTGNAGTTWIHDNSATNGISEHGIADVTMPLGSIVGLFLDNNLPDSTAAPSPLDFSTQASRDYLGIKPALKQPFFMGDGTTSTNSAQQQIVVPANATRMFLGVMDGWEWNNNRGGFNVSIVQATVTTVQ